MAKVQATATLQRAGMLARKGEREAARSLYQAVLADWPNNPRAQAGLAALDTGEVTSLVSGLAVFNAHMAAGQHGDALQVGASLVLRHELSGEAWHALAIANAELGKLAEAAAAFERALALAPRSGDIWRNSGKALVAANRFPQALSAFNRALEIDPADVTALLMKGMLLAQIGQYAEAIAVYENALELAPDDIKILVNLANTLRVRGDPQRAVTCLGRALELEPRNESILINCASLLDQIGKNEVAFQFYGRALAVNPDRDEARVEMLTQMRLVCDWRQLNPHLPVEQLGMRDIVVSPLATMAFEDHPQRHLLRARKFCAAMARIEPLPLPPPPATRPGRLRIGYFSPDFQEHAVMYLLGGILDRHDRDRFEIHAFSYGFPSDTAMRGRAMREVDHFHDVWQMSHADTAALARSEGLDIAVDLAGHTRYSRIDMFAHRPAPVQIGYLGFPGSTGAEWIDYVIGDPVVIPRASGSCFSERIIRLPGCYLPTDPRLPVDPELKPRAAYGLAEGAFVFCCLNKSSKIGPQEFAIWMRLLQRVPGSQLWLTGAGSKASENLRGHARKAGVDPERLVFAGHVDHPEHLARQRHADLFLDTFEYNAHTTGIEALLAGVPLVTRPGGQFAARVGASMLVAAGLPDLIAEDAAGYEELAFRLATDPERMASIRARSEGVREHSALFDAAAYVRHLESAFDAAWERWRSGASPADIDIGAD
jgi:protein O-GlcNAc transferase